jgi:hypothetical protein
VDQEPDLTEEPKEGEEEEEDMDANRDKLTIRVIKYTFFSYMILHFKIKFVLAMIVYK